MKILSQPCDPCYSNNRTVSPNSKTMLGKNLEKPVCVERRTLWLPYHEATFVQTMCEHWASDCKSNREGETGREAVTLQSPGGRSLILKDRTRGPSHGSLVCTPGEVVETALKNGESRHLSVQTGLWWNVCMCQNINMRTWLCTYWQIWRHIFLCLYTGSFTCIYVGCLLISSSLLLPFIVKQWQRRGNRIMKGTR